MQTLREICSDLSNDINAINLDDRKSFRYLANKFRDQISYFLRLEARSREILKEMGLWQPLECIDLEDAPASCCLQYDCATSLKRSVKQIPEAYATNYGLLIKVFLADGREVKLINSFDYRDYINREYKTTKLVYWIEDKYIFIPDTTVEVVKGSLLPKDPIDVEKFNCTADQCASPLDGKITYSDYLITLAKQEVFKQLAGGKGIPEDEKGDDNTNKK